MSELAGVYVRGEPLNWWVCKLLEILDDKVSGITSLCYRRLHDRACAVTGRPFEPADQEGWERHQASLRAAAAAGAPPPGGCPSPTTSRAATRA